MTGVLIKGRKWASQVAVLKNLPTDAGDLRDSGLIPGLGGSPGVGNGNPGEWPGEFRGQRSLMGCSPWGRKRVGRA